MAFFGQPVGDLDQGEIALIFDPVQNLRGMPLNTMAVAVAANGFRRNTAGALEPLMPAHSRRNRNIELRRCRPSRKTAFDRSNNAKTQIIG